MSTAETAFSSNATFCVIPFYFFGFSRCNLWRVVPLCVPVPIYDQAFFWCVLEDLSPESIHVHGTDHSTGKWGVPLDSCRWRVGFDFNVSPIVLWDYVGLPRFSRLPSYLSWFPFGIVVTRLQFSYSFGTKLVTLIELDDPINCGMRFRVTFLSLLFVYVLKCMYFIASTWTDLTLLSCWLLSDINH